MVYNNYMLSAFVISQILVGGALVLNLISFQLKKRAAVVATLSTSTALVAAHLYFLKQIAPALLVLYAVFYFLVSLKTTSRWVMLLFMFGSVGIFVARYASPLDWFILAPLLLLCFLCIIRAKSVCDNSSSQAQA